MKKWNEYTKSERIMIIVIGALIVLVLISSGRVNSGIKNGFRHFFTTPADTEQTVKP